MQKQRFLLVIIKINKYTCPVSICSLFILFNGCVEPFKPALDENDTENLLVVEGLITDDPGPFSVRLTSSVPVYDKWNVVSDFLPVSGAEVQITDNRGNAYLLFENDAGWYQTEEKDLKGIPGNAYTLTITTPDGMQYESYPVLMRDVPEIDSLYSEEFTRTYFDQETPYKENWLNILVDTRAEGEEITYFKWEFEETWEFEMPEYVWVDHGPEAGAPPSAMELIDIDYERKHCWTAEASKSILIKSTVDNSLNEIKSFTLQSIGPPDDRLNINYSILVKQYVIDRDLYNFFRKIRESNEESGGIYEKTPVQILGNIQCCNGEEEALGYFMASAVKTKRIFIHPYEHNVAEGTAYGNCGWTTYINPRDYQVYYIYGSYNNGNTIVKTTSEYCTDCRVRGSNMKPDFWE